MSDLPKKTRGRPKKITDESIYVDEANVDVIIKEAKRLLSNSYILTVSIGDFLFSTETDDVAGALLGIKPAKINQKVIFTLAGNGMFVTKPMMPLKAKMIFARRLTAEFFVKRLILSMK